MNSSSFPLFYKLLLREPAMSLRRHQLGQFVARAAALRTGAGSAAIGALPAIARSFAHGALARSTAHVAFHFVFRHFDSSIGVGRPE